jgi:hypothetical protein
MGKPVKLTKGSMEFDRGFVLDMGSNTIPDHATVTVQEVQPFSGMESAGLSLQFTFDGIEITQPVTLSYPIEAGDATDDVGIFYKKQDRSWEYVNTTSVQNGRAIATVDHFSTYGVYHASKVSPVSATPAGGLIDGNRSISLSTSTPGAVIYYRQGSGDFARYESAVVTNGGAIEAYAIADNMRDSEVTSWTYSTATANVADSQHIQITFSEPLQSGDGSQITLQNGQTYSLNIAAVNGSQQLAIASGTQTGSHSVLLTLANDSSAILQNTFVVKFFDQTGSYTAQTNSFLLGTPPRPEPPDPEIPPLDIEVNMEGSAAYIFWGPVEGAVNYEICLKGIGGDDYCPGWF